MSKLLAEWFWTDRWMGSSAFLLPIAARGLYREMLTQAWRRGAVLPKDPMAIQRACGVTAEEWAENWPLVERYWIEDGETIYNETQREIYADSEEKHFKRVEAGRKGGKKRAANAQAKLEAKLEAAPQAKSNSPSPSPSQDQDQDQSPSPKRKRGKRAPSPPSKEAVEVAAHLRDAILEHSPDHACGRNGRWEKWARDIDLAIRIDGRDPIELRGAVDFAHRHPHETFWRPNLQSGKKLREKFDTLKAQAARASGSRVNTQAAAAIERFIARGQD